MRACVRVCNAMKGEDFVIVLIERCLNENVVQSHNAHRWFLEAGYASLLTVFAHAVTTCTRCAGVRMWVHPRVCVRGRVCGGYVTKRKNNVNRLIISIPECFSI